MLIRNVSLRGKRADLRIASGVICEIAAELESNGNSEFNGHGGELLPGLHDHHIHLNASAASMNSVQCGPPKVLTAEALLEALHGAEGTAIRGVAYHHSVAGEIDRAWLDANGPHRPIRIQHRSGRLWILNSLAMEMLKLRRPTDGRLLDEDDKLRAASQFPDLRPLVKRLLSCGITGVTEVTPSNGKAEFQNYLLQARPLKLCVMGNAQLSKSEDVHIGPLKLHYHDHNLPSLDKLAFEMKRAHVAGRNIAAHCVTRAEIMLTLAALDQAGPKEGDRIEHAAIADEMVIEWMKALGVTVVTQPNFIVERFEAYRKDVSLEDHPHLWRLKSFQEAGLKLAAGSDAPFGSPNPWAAMDAAVRRPTGFESEAISPEAALELYTKPSHDAGAAARTIKVGAAADLCLIDRPWAQARTDLSAVNVSAAWIAGELVHNRIDQAPF